MYSYLVDYSYCNLVLGLVENLTKKQQKNKTTLLGAKCSVFFKYLSFFDHLR